MALNSLVHNRMLSLVQNEWVCAPKQQSGNDKSRLRTIRFRSRSLLRSVDGYHITNEGPFSGRSAKERMVKMEKMAQWLKRKRLAGVAPTSEGSPRNVSPRVAGCRPFVFKPPGEDRERGNQLRNGRRLVLALETGPDIGSLCHQKTLRCPSLAGQAPRKQDTFVDR